MFLLSRPPLLRWVVAVALVVVALWADLRPAPTVEHPFASTEIAAGDPITAADITMVPVPPGLFDSVELPATAGRAIHDGEPVLMAALDPDQIESPEGWLLVELAFPDGARPGSAVVAIVSGPDDEPTSHEGVVVTVGIDDGFGGRLAGCAFPPDDAATVAVAVAENRISVLIGG